VGSETAKNSSALDDAQDAPTRKASDAPANDTPASIDDAAAPRGWILALACAVISAAVFAPALGGDFIFDDVLLIPTNRYIHSVEWIGRWFSHDFWDLDLAATQVQERLQYYRPLITASYAIDWSIGGGSPALFHATNLALQAAVAWLCFETLQRWSGSRVAAALATLVFTLHPTKAESVAWIAGRPDVVVMLAMLLAVSGIAMRLRGRRAGIVLEAAGTTLAYLAKEHAVVLPLLAAVEGWVVASRPALSWGLIKKGSPVMRAALPQALVAMAYVGARALWFPVRRVEIRGLDALEHVALVLETLGRYFELIVWPADLSLNRAALRSTANGPELSVVYSVLGALILLAAGLAIVRTRRRHPHVAIGTAFVVATLIPVSNVVYSGFFALVSPRLLYVPTFGVAVALAIGLASSASRRVHGAVLTGLLALGLGARSWVRAGDFASPVRFWDYEASHCPDAPIALEGAIRMDRAADRPRSALRRASCAHAAANRSFSHTGDAGAFAQTGLELLLELSPDAPPDALEQQRRFIANVLSPHPGPAAIASREARFVYDPETKAGKRLREHVGELGLLLAKVESRLGNDAHAVRAAEAALADCGDCVDRIAQAALIAARAGDFDRAFAWLDRVPDPLANQRQLIAMARDVRQRAARAPLQISAQLMAQFYWTLGAWGRAYREMQPYQREIEAAGPRAVVEYSRLAFRAGDHATARRLLERGLPGQADALLQDWRADEAHSQGDGEVPPTWNPDAGCYWGSLLR
jgi:hypothetical protein